MPEVIKIKELKNGLKVAELFHGPTLAFKDLALGVVGGLYNYFLERSKKKCIVIVGKQHEATEKEEIIPLWCNARNVIICQLNNFVFN